MNASMIKKQGSGLNRWFVGWIRNAIQYLCVNKQDFFGWRYAYPSYSLTDLTHHQKYVKKGGDGYLLNRVILKPTPPLFYIF